MKLVKRESTKLVRQNRKLDKNYFLNAHERNVFNKRTSDLSHPVLKGMTEDELKAFTKLPSWKQKSILEGENNQLQERKRPVNDRAADSEYKKISEESNASTFYDKGYYDENEDGESGDREIEEQETIPIVQDSSSNHNSAARFQYKQTMFRYEQQKKQRRLARQGSKQPIKSQESGEEIVFGKDRSGYPHTDHQTAGEKIKGNVTAETSSYYSSKGNAKVMHFQEEARTQVVKNLGRLETVRQYAAVAAREVDDGRIDGAVNYAVSRSSRGLAKGVMNKVRSVVAATVKKALAALIQLIPAGAAMVMTAFLLILIILLVTIAAFGALNDNGAAKAQKLSAQVEAYRGEVSTEAAKYGMSEYVELLLAVMMQESGGRGLDPMQAAEGGFNTRYPHEPNGITDPAYSIECGVQELKAALDLAGVSGPTDMTNIRIALQAYNFGGGFISYMKKQGYSEWSYDVACAFAESTGWGLRADVDSAAGPYKYGDQHYPEHVLQYYGVTENVSGAIPNNGLPIPEYHQADYSDVHYGDGSIASSGCAPSSMSMVISYLTGTAVTPADVVAWCGDSYFVGTTGTGWDFFAAAAEHYQIGAVTETYSTEEVRQALEDGRPVISSQSAGIFTRGGHFIVLRGITTEGMILVNDPNDSEEKNHINMEFDLDRDIDATSKMYWIFEAKEASAAKEAA